MLETKVTVSTEQKLIWWKCVVSPAWLDKPHPGLQRTYGSDDATGTGKITDRSDVEWKLKMPITRTQTMWESSYVPSQHCIKCGLSLLCL